MKANFPNYYRQKSIQMQKKNYIAHHLHYNYEPLKFPPFFSCHTMDDEYDVFLECSCLCIVLNFLNNNNNNNKEKIIIIFLIIYCIAIVKHEHGRERIIG